MGAIIDGFLGALVLIFTIRLYRTNRLFNQVLNKLFDRIEDFHQTIKKKMPFGVLGYSLIPAALFIIYLLIVSYQNGNFIDTLLVITILMIPTIPLYLQVAHRLNSSDCQNVIDLINNGEIKDEELDKLKLAIKKYYETKYAPKNIDHKDPSFLDKLIEKVAILVIWVIYPGSFTRFIIPKITAIPMFASFFYYSPYHARFKDYWNLLDLIIRLGSDSPLRIRVENIDVDEDRVIINILKQGKHLENRLKVLAGKIEEKYGMANGAIMIQENEENLKYFIPKESLIPIH